MNAVSVSNHTDFIQENGNGSDTDSNPDEPQSDYSAVDCAADDESDDGESLTKGYESHHRVLPNRIASVVLNNDGGGLEEERLQSDCEEKERRREEEIRRAFNEDETRRNAPLTMENAARVREAMRGVSFSGFASDWAQSVPEDNWTDGLRRLRRTTANFSASTSFQN